MRAERLQQSSVLNELSRVLANWVGGCLAGWLSLCTFAAAPFMSTAMHAGVRQAHVSSACLHPALHACASHSPHERAKQLQGSTPRLFQSRQLRGNDRGRRCLPPTSLISCAIPTCCFSCMLCTCCRHCAFPG